MTSISRLPAKALLQKLRVVHLLLLLLLLLLLNQNRSLDYLPPQQLRRRFLALRHLIQVLQIKALEYNLLSNLINHPLRKHIMLRQPFLPKEQGQYHHLPPRDLTKHLGFLLLLPELERFQMLPKELVVLLRRPLLQGLLGVTLLLPLLQELLETIMFLGNMINNKQHPPTKMHSIHPHFHLHIIRYLHKRHHLANLRLTKILDKDHNSLSLLLLQELHIHLHLPVYLRLRVEALLRLLHYHLLLPAALLHLLHYHLLRLVALLHLHPYLLRIWMVLVKLHHYRRLIPQEMLFWLQLEVLELELSRRLTSLSSRSLACCYKRRKVNLQVFQVLMQLLVLQQLV
mmetsp:Transcript_5923/g.5853  ORF Transcript_5923/g.5853 Transcript_5923/m.5853 type:complete len:343 (-) Transcript_5923:198-1226(-)